MAAGQEGNLKTREVSYKNVWRISNLRTICENGQLGDQSFTLTTHVGNTICTWLIGLEKQSCLDLDGVFIYLECTLCEIKGNISPTIKATLKAYMESSFQPKAKCTVYEVNQKEKIWVAYIHLSDDPVTINVEFLFPQIVEEEKGERYAIQSVNTLKENMAKLLADEKSSDLKIITSDGVELLGHKVILQAQNPVFASMLRSDLSESKTGVIKVDDICGNTMKLILRYLYTGDLLSTWEEADIIVEFTYAAGKYQLTEVLEMLDASLGNDMSEGHRQCITPLLSLASKLSLRNAEKMLLKQFVNHAAKAETAEELFALMGNQGTNDTETSSD